MTLIICLASPYERDLVRTVSGYNVLSYLHSNDSLLSVANVLLSDHGGIIPNS